MALSKVDTAIRVPDSSLTMKKNHNCDVIGAECTFINEYMSVLNQLFSYRF